MPRKVLIVDDEPGFTRIVTLALPQYDFMAVNDSRKAVAAAIKFKPDVILLDLMMPGLNGVDLAYAMRAERDLQGVPIIFVTACADSEHHVEDSQFIAGFPCLQKPVGAQVLEAAIKEQLAIRR
jgi:DNA-binding response OmpR family regulator